VVVVSDEIISADEARDDVTGSASMPYNSRIASAILVLTVFISISR
jgi:hypothetical protein